MDSCFVPYWGYGVGCYFVPQRATMTIGRTIGVAAAVPILHSPTANIITHCLGDPQPDRLLGRSLLNLSRPLYDRRAVWYWQAITAVASSNSAYRDGYPQAMGLSQPWSSLARGRH
jgi:hypothetical protein